jgi:three-Cys-motif partner protein
MENKTLFGDPDEFDTPEVKAHTEDKYDPVRYYCDLFSKGMQYKWAGRVYVDLYSGSGKCRIKGTNKILLGSSLIALSVEVPFDRYIFCESDTVRLSALRERVRRIAPERDVQFIEGDCNEQLARIRGLIPKNNLVLCFVDPYNCNIHYETLLGLASGLSIDFLCLLAFQMDARRASAHYLNPENRKLDVMLGNSDWRIRWMQEKLKGSNFARFLALEFARSMEGLGFRRTALADMKVIKIRKKNVSLYYLALFSRSPVAFKYWDQVLNYSSKQRTLPF